VDRRPSIVQTAIAAKGSDPAYYQRQRRAGALVSEAAADPVSRK